MLSLDNAFDATEFTEFCARNGWTACFYSVTERFKNIAAAALRIA